MTTFTTPIIMSAPMIRALLDGRKSQTRRLPTNQWRNLKTHFDQGERCFVWVREAFYASENGDPIYHACKDDGLASLVEFVRDRYDERWKPSIHMPRWASRLTLEVSDVRVQQLQDISETDAMAEGVEPVLTGADQLYGWLNYEHRDPGTGYYSEAVNSYLSLWEKLHGEGSWGANPDVFAISFRVHHQNLDALLADQSHPDAGGPSGAMQKLTEALDKLRCAHG